MGSEMCIRDSWYQEQADVNPTDFGRDPATYEEVRPFIEPTLDALKVVVDNGDSPERLSYPDDDPQTVIAIGGNTLSRGG